MTLIRWKPLRTELSPFCGENWSPVSRLMEDFFNTVRSSDVTVWGPNVDIVENEASFEIYAELPGVKQEDVKITLDNNVLTLTGEKKQDVKEEKGAVCRMERVYGRFERRFSLPATVRADSVRATFEDGVLRIHLPKAAESRSQTIPIEKK